MSAQADDLRAPARSTARLFVERHAATAIKFLLTLAASGFVAYGAAQRKQGAADAQGEARLAGVEQSVETLKTNLVPRAESEARLAGVEQALGAIRADVRETREDVRETRATTTAILFKLTGEK